MSDVPVADDTAARRPAAEDLLASLSGGPAHRRRVARGPVSAYAIHA